MFDKILDFPVQLWLVPGMFIAFLLGGTDRRGHLNAWGMVLIAPFYLLGYLTLVVVIFLGTAVPVVVVLYTPLCVFLSDSSCLAQLAALFR